MSMWMRSRMLVALALGVVMSAAGAGQLDVYVTHSAKRGMPIFTDSPSDAGARPVFTYRAASPVARAPQLVPVAYARAGKRRSAADVQAVLAHARQAARRHGLDTALVVALIEVESAFRSDALSPAGAMGLMQLMPQTARRFDVSDPWEPRDNVDGGSRYLRYLIDFFDGDLRLALAGYNAGEGNVLKAGRRVPPFAETQRYVPAVLERLRHWRSVLRDEAVH